MLRAQLRRHIVPVAVRTPSHRCDRIAIAAFPRGMASAAADERFKLVFFAPPQHLPEIRAAIFAAGAGRYPGPGGYTECCFTTPGIGQFRPGEAANPAIGARGQVEEVGEARCETICVGRDVARRAVDALKKAHPYEEPAYEVYKMEEF